MTAPTSGPGSQMGTKSRAILECLRKHGRKNRLDLEMILSIGPFGPAVSRLKGFGYIAKVSHGSAMGCYEITRQGRVALGEALALPEPTAIRICAATTSGHYIPGLHNISQTVRRL
jgi:hypothetical protein